MSWRNELKLADLPAGEALEIACPKCGAARYATAAELSAHKMPGALDGETVSVATAYLDQVEARLRCRRCGGPGRLSRVWQDKISGFVGGFALRRENGAGMTLRGSRYCHPRVVSLFERALKASCCAGC